MVTEMWTGGVAGKPDLCAPGSRTRPAQQHGTDQAGREDQPFLQRMKEAQDALFDPLARIRGFAETLLRWERSLGVGERQEFLQEIVDASEQLDRMIRSVLELTRLQAVALGLHTAVVDTDRIVRQAIMAVAQRAPMDGEQRRRFRLLTGGLVWTLVAPYTPRTTWRQERHSPDHRQRLAIVGDRRLVRTALLLALEYAVRSSPVGGSIDVTLEATAPGLSERHTAPMQTETLASAVVVTGGAREASLPVPSLPMPSGAFGEGAPSEVSLIRPSALIRICFTELAGSTEPPFVDLDLTLFREAAVRVGGTDDDLVSGLALCRFLIEAQGGAIWIRPTSAQEQSQEQRSDRCIECVLPLAAEAAPTGTTGT